MCGRDSEKLNSKSLCPSGRLDMSYSGKGEHSFSSLLELAADNDVEGFKQSICDNLSAIDEVGLWYCCHGVSRKRVLDSRTPLMVAAKYGSVDVVKLILSLPESDVNLSCGLDKSTALHCAASGGSVNAVDVVKLLLLAGADLNVADGNGDRPVDVIVSHPNCPDSRVVLEELLGSNGSVCLKDLQVSTVSSKSSSPSLLSSDNGSLSSVSDLSLSSVSCKPDYSFALEKKEYPVDPSLPDINNGIYSSDEFRMFSFKIRPCSRAYSHDWTECPFAHPGENARRRDPRKFHYSCVPCPDFRKGTCGRGDMCDYAHGVFESWLHPAQYRTRLCKDGTSCTRRVCFFAHMPQELRPLYMSTGSGMPSPRSTMAMSPNDLPHSSMGWPQQSIPTLHLPGSNLQTSRLRSSLNARDILAEEDFQMQQQQLLNSLSACSRTLTPTNLDRLFYGEVSSPRHSNQLQQQQSMLSPIKTHVGVSSPMRMSPRKVEPISPMSSRLSTYAYHEKLQQQLCNSSPREHGSNLSRDLKPNSVVGSPMNSWSQWESPNVGDELSRLRNSYSFGRNEEEETPKKFNERTTIPPSTKEQSIGAEVSNLNPSSDHLGTWLEQQLQLDRIVA